MFSRSSVALVTALLASSVTSLASAQTAPPGHSTNVWVMPGAAPVARATPAPGADFRQAPSTSAPAPSAPVATAATYASSTSTYPAPAPTYAAPASTYAAPASTYPAAASNPVSAPTYYPAAANGANGAWAQPGHGYRPAGPPRAESPQAGAEANKPRDYHFDLGVGTEVPISVGGVLTAELPHRFLLQVGVGVMPTAYSDAIDGFLTSVGAYNAAVSQAVRASLGNSLVVRTSIGGRPFSGHGFEILAGYTLIKGNGSLDTTDAITAILAETGTSLPAPSSLGEEIPIGATLHNFHASIGWRWLVADERLVLRASLSYLQTLASEVQVDIPDSATEVAPFEAEINRQVNAYMTPFFSKYAKAPTLGLSAAFRF